MGLLGFGLPYFVWILSAWTWKKVKSYCQNLAFFTARFYSADFFNRDSFNTTSFVSWIQLFFIYCVMEDVFCLNLVVSIIHVVIDEIRVFCQIYLWKVTCTIPVVTIKLTERVASDTSGLDR